MSKIGFAIYKISESKLRFASAVQLFKSFCNCSLPQVLGAIDGNQIEILKPDNESSMDCFSREQKYTVNPHAVVGSNLTYS